jgi:hypothetical protein
MSIGTRSSSRGTVKQNHPDVDRCFPSKGIGRSRSKKAPRKSSKTRCCAKSCDGQTQKSIASTAEVPLDEGTQTSALGLPIWQCEKGSDEFSEDGSSVSPASRESSPTSSTHGFSLSRGVQQISTQLFSQDEEGFGETISQNARLK